MQAYCVRCRTKRERKDAKRIVVLGSGNVTHAMVADLSRD